MTAISGLAMRGLVMRGLGGAAIVATGLCLLVPVSAARAQVTFDAPGFLKQPPKAGPPLVRAKPPPWPRLDPGAVLCRTQEDLKRLAANRTGGPGGGPADCRVITSPTPIQIVHREGLGRTEVAVTNPTTGKPGETGWTDTWLPSKPPSTP